MSLGLFAALGFKYEGEPTDFLLIPYQTSAALEVLHERFRLPWVPLEGLYLSKHDTIIIEYLRFKILKQILVLPSCVGFV